MKKLVALGLATAFAANVAQADPITFDPDGSGTDYSPILVDLFSLNIRPATASYSVFQDFGADNALNDGDTFSETFTFNWTEWSEGLNFGGFGTDVQWTLTLDGYITDVQYDAGVPTITDPLNDFTGNTSFLDDLANTSFQTVFNPTSVSPSVNMTATYMGNVIGIFDLLAGVSGTPVALADDNSAAFVFKFKMNETFAANFADFDNVWSDHNGDPLDQDLIFAVGDGSTTINGVTGFTQDQQTGNWVADISVSDNGATLEFNVPEPTSLAALGLGLLGLAGFRRFSK
ncbi:PEP-CTERM sorting domain-containing protein [Alteromonas flava]|uniref:PEP-CTERM sorting domain-containing protein n=1 Tax=Alteromonas flava TaxID=2048003 RepID=UPI000C287C62|nr:PEP-CTERM sorting domain-containing protein [Alteromonas flava]